jgi:hypothetical protein
MELNIHIPNEEVKVPNKYMKKCSTSFAIREMQSKTLRFHIIAVRMAIIKNTNMNNYGEDVE